MASSPWSLIITTVLASSFVLLLSYIVVSSTINYRRLRQFKGPPLAAFSRFWLFWEECSARLPKSQRAAIQRYGSPARIAPNLLVTDDPDLVRHMNAPGSRWTRSGWYDAMKMDPRKDNVFSTRNEKLHAELKAKEAPGYNGRDIATLESDIDARIGDLIYLIKNTYNGVSMEFANVSRFFTLDVLSTVAFGRPFGFMAANEDLWGYNKLNASFMFLLGLQANHTSIYKFFTQPWLLALAAPKPTDKAGIGPALAFAQKAVGERYGPDAKVKKDMLGSFVSKGLDQQQCEVEAFLQIIAGSDSTTGVLRAIFFLLAGSPPVYAKLQAEVDSAAKTQPQGRVIAYKEALKLPHLQAVIYESLRLYPPLFGLKSKCAPPEGETINGTFYPPGTEVCICDDAVCRRKDIFGEDSEVFRPERFLEGDDEAVRKERIRTVEVVFGTGRFQCLGKHIAWMELSKGVFELMKTFDFQMTDPMRGIDTYAHNVHIMSNLLLVMRPRDSTTQGQ
ncbi:hypothetical protein M409DRAFT_68501 [Zasmidium cellare ATCC 36951]|uniref:Cytochrome P450 n=1 Tax=Zasmidium cellare ATCC 36951 TaxID=1080233 RepID=A0A6A6CDV3_ZASCE|nr:uncharacterized protein M409DRAFT_68501 [Zasmidium cellare ATCC 36951]KAF2163606.1 hypothetical protein M409DRAFT_68501 [Zasmidium cellare ATCC 36951]